MGPVTAPVTAADPVVSRQVYDVAVVGGGPVGLAMAAALVSGLPGLAVALVAPEAGGPDPRASAVGGGGRNLFQAIGAWGEMAPHANPIARMVLTDSGPDDLARPALLGLESAGTDRPGEPGAQFIAHMVPNGAIMSALETLIAGKVTRITARVESLVADRGATRLGLDPAGRLCARLVIAADGGNSPIRDMARIPTVAHDYRQSGVVATIAHGQPHGDTAYQHFRPHGPLASLPLTGNRSSLVWTETMERAALLCEMAPDAVAREIEAVMGSVLGAVTLETPVRRFPLALRLARRVTAERLALIGDAAHVIHPLAGQGFNLGLKDVAALAEALADGLRMGLDAGDAAMLARYAAERRFDTATLALATDGLNRLFSNDNDALRALRDFGLASIDRMAGIKAAMVDRAAGASGPRLLRGRAL